MLAITALSALIAYAIALFSDVDAEYAEFAEQPQREHFTLDLRAPAPRKAPKPLGRESWVPVAYRVQVRPMERMMRELDGYLSAHASA